MVVDYRLSKLKIYGTRKMLIIQKPNLVIYCYYYWESMLVSFTQDSGSLVTFVAIFMYHKSKYQSMS